MSGRRNLVIASIVAAATVALSAPPAVSAGIGGDVIDEVRDTVGGLTGGDGGGGGGSPLPAPPVAPAPPSEPAPAPVAAGAEGTAAVVDLDPGDEQGDEEVVVGRSRGEQDEDGRYHGQVTVLSVFGLEVPLFETRATDEGETDDGPLAQLNGALDDVCESSDEGLCVNVLEVDSRTSSDGSHNSFSAVDADGRFGDESVSADALSSEGNISDDGNCQTSEGSSEVAGAGADSGSLGERGEVHAFTSRTGSRACNDGSSDQDADSEVLNVLGTTVLTPVEGCDGSPEGSPDVDTAEVVAVECAGGSSDSSAGEASASRDSLGATAVPDEEGGGAGAGTAASANSSASAPAKGDDDDGDPGDDGDDPADDGDGADAGVLAAGGGDASGPGGQSADPDSTGGSLPFTGAELGALALIGLGVIAIGMAAMAISDRRRRAPTS